MVCHTLKTRFRGVPDGVSLTTILGRSSTRDDGDLDNLRKWLNSYLLAPVSQKGLDAWLREVVHARE